MGLENQEQLSGTGDTASGRAAFSDEYVRTARADAQAVPDARDDRPDNHPEHRSGAGQSPDIEVMKSFYPVVGAHFDEYKQLVDGDDPKAYLAAEPTFRQLVGDSDRAFAEQEASTRSALERLGPGLVDFKRDYLGANKALAEQWDKTPEDEQKAIEQKIASQGIPLSEAAKDHPELAAAARRAEGVFSSNPELVMKLTDLQAWLNNTYQQKIFAREMHGDTLGFGAGAADQNTAQSMLADKAIRDREVKDLYSAGAPNIFDYIEEKQLRD